MEYIPKIGFGTYKLQGETVISSVIHALNNGYRHIDTAHLYNNETEIGEAIKKCNIKRNELWITTKISIREILKGEEFIYNSILSSLKRLDTEYLDLILLHGPVNGKLTESWIILEEIILGNIPSLKNKVRYIGVSNYDIDHLNNILPICRIKPYANQFEISPYLNRVKLINFCKENKIIVVAHTSLIKGHKFNDIALENISNKIKISKPLILLAWALHHGITILPRSSNPQHIQENITCLNVKLSDNIMNDLNNFYKVDTYCTHPQYVNNKFIK